VPALPLFRGLSQALKNVNLVLAKPPQRCFDSNHCQFGDQCYSASHHVCCWVWDMVCKTGWEPMRGPQVPAHTTYYTRAHAQAASSNNTYGIPPSFHTPLNTPCMCLLFYQRWIWSVLMSCWLTEPAISHARPSHLVRKREREPAATSKTVAVAGVHPPPLPWR
jgi:hypothetical protein